jgi:hypothetical protein
MTLRRSVRTTVTPTEAVLIPLYRLRHSRWNCINLGITPNATESHATKSPASAAGLLNSTAFLLCYGVTISIEWLPCGTVATTAGFNPEG